MSGPSRSEAHTGRVALLWDESFLWGVMAYQALTSAGLPFDLIRSEDIRGGALARYRMLFVPGGWASNKAKALGEEGARAIRDFVKQGGNYLGFCGGAGLATRDGIGLVPVHRRPTPERVPSFSGRIRLKVVAHPVWEKVSERRITLRPGAERSSPGENADPTTPNPDVIFHVWWPSQFVAEEGVAVLASYGEALPDAFTSDVNVGDGNAMGMWADLESLYRINLDPKRLIGEPAVIEGRYGTGTVLLSLVHFDTPGDDNGAVVLRNLWSYLGCAGNSPKRIHESPPPKGDVSPAPDNGMATLQQAADELIEVGLRNFLWFRRNPLLLQWRRGVRGLEYCTLSVMIREVAARLASSSAAPSPEIAGRIRRIERLMQPFAAKARELLLRERLALQHEHLTYDRCRDPNSAALRDELFSRSKNHGGAFKILIDEIDRLLYHLLTLKR